MNDSTTATYSVLFGLKKLVVSALQYCEVVRDETKLYKV